MHFRFTAAPKAKRCWWLVLEPPATDLCLTDPGYGTDLTVRSDPVVLASVYMGDIASGRRPCGAATITLEGPSHLVRGFPEWFGLSSLIGIRQP